MSILKIRPRRLRRSETIRAMVRETSLSAKDFVYPIFVVPGDNIKEEIPSMPGCYHLSVDKAVETAKEIASLGIPSVEVFGLPEYKDELAKHFEYEEKTVFPHAEAVLRKGADRTFTIGEYEENHSNVEEKLEDLKNLVMKYMPAECGQQDIFKALFYVFSLETDLEKHTVVENDILVPIVNRLENHE